MTSSHFLYQVCLLLTMLLTLSDRLDAENWPEFRGPTGQGHAQTSRLPDTWSETKNIAWKTAIPGRGWSSPVIEGDEIWMTTAHSTPASDEEKAERTRGNTNSQPLIVVNELSMRAICVQRSTGRLLHDIELMTEARPAPINPQNSFASPTPVLEDGRLYCLFGTYGTACLDTRTTKVVWTNRDLRLNHENGPGSSPISYRNLLIFHCDGSDVQYIVALNKSTGTVAWKTDRSGTLHSHPQTHKAYGTPLIVRRGQQSQLISPAADWVYCYDPNTGKELWKLSYGVLGFSIVPRPVAANGLVYICTSFMRSELLAVRYDSPNGDPVPHIAWRYGKQVPQKPSPLVVGSEFYMVGDRGVATCLDAKTGEVRWVERLGGNFSASPVYASGRIYFFDQDGVTTVVESGKTFKLVAKNQLDGGCMASPAVVDGAFYLRTDKALHRIQALP